MIWLRVGGCGEQEPFGNLRRAVGYLNDLHVGKVRRWQNDGVETQNYWGADYIRLYRGDADGNLATNLLPDERVYVEDTLEEAYL